MLAVLSGCKRNDAEQAVKELMGKTISFEWDKTFINSDTVIDDNNYELQPIKIVTHMDETSCVPCINTYITFASDVLREYGYSEDSIKYYVILHRTQKEAVDCFDGKTIPFIELVNDINDVYLEKNGLDSYESMYTTFLLNEKNEIVVIGDPLRSLGVRRLYFSKIDELLDNIGAHSD